nr:immunoglobulin light chain junction region [Macaca mulatta]
CKHYYSTPYSF